MFNRYYRMPWLLLSIVLAPALPTVAQYDPPPGYYNPAIGLTGAPLKAALNGIIDGHTSFSYSNREVHLEVLDEDPNNSANVLQVYSGFSVAKTQFPTGTANTEHLWPNSYGIDDGNPAYGDLYNLRPCDASVNTDRGNKYYDDGGTLPAHPEAPLCRDDADSWEARPVEKGDLARSMFYMDTRYEGDGTDGFARNLTLTDNVALITDTNNNMGKLSTLILWHFTDPVATDEQIRNQANFDDHQHNRNPFIDHPEYVWAIWGATPNDSRLYFGAIEPGDGASAAVVDLGDMIKDGPVPGPQNITLNKSGANPTTYDVTLAGQASAASAGPRKGFLGGVQSLPISVGLSTSTATVGLKTGSLTVDNTDLTSSGAGHGSDDGNDVADISLRVLDHADASFDDIIDQNSATIDFGGVTVGTGVHNLNFTVYNLEAAPVFTAGLDLDSAAGAGDTAVLTTDLAPFSNLAAGSDQTFTASLDSAALGSYSATYTISLSDQNLPGAQPTADLVLTLVGEVAVPSCVAADANCDEELTFDDVEPFVEALLEVSSPCSSCAADTNGDTLLDGGDIQPFVAAIMGI